MFRTAGKRNPGMGAVNGLGYRPGNSILYRLDPRTKQIMVMVLGSACFFAPVLFLVIVSLLVLFCCVTSGMGLRNIVGEIRYFLLFLLFVFIVRVVTLNDNFFPVPDVSEVSGALLFCWKLLLIVLMGVLLIVTTRTGEIRAALVWGLRPVPLVRERAAATMVSLVVRLLPLILFQAGEIGDAMRARGIENRKNPAVRLTGFTSQLFRRAFSRADDLVDAMQARCYNDGRTMPELSFGTEDVCAAVVCLLLIAILFLS